MRLTFDSPSLNLCKKIIKAHAYIMDVKSYTRTFKNGFATQLNESLLAQSYILPL